MSDWVGVSMGAAIRWRGPQEGAVAPAAERNDRTLKPEPKATCQVRSPLETPWIDSMKLKLYQMVELDLKSVGRVANRVSKCGPVHTAKGTRELEAGATQPKPEHTMDTAVSPCRSFNHTYVLPYQ